MLERPREPGPPAAVRRPARDLDPAELDPARGRQVEAGEQVHERRLPGPVRPDQADDLALLEREVDILERLDACERARDAEGPERSGPSASLVGDYRQPDQWMFGIFCVVCSPMTLATLLFTSITR